MGLDPPVRTGNQQRLEVPRSCAGVQPGLQVVRGEDDRHPLLLVKPGHDLIGHRGDHGEGLQRAFRPWPRLTQPRKEPVATIGRMDEVGALLPGDDRPLVEAGDRDQQPAPLERRTEAA